MVIFLLKAKFLNTSLFFNVHLFQNYYNCDDFFKVHSLLSFLPLFLDLSLTMVFFSSLGWLDSVCLQLNEGNRVNEITLSADQDFLNGCQWASLCSLFSVQNINEMSRKVSILKAPTFFWSWISKNYFHWKLGLVCQGWLR